MSKVIKKLLKKNYTADFKQEAVKLLMDNGYTLGVAAERLGISKSTLSKWRHKLLNAKRDVKTAFPGKGYLKPEDAAFKELQKEVERLRRERDVLKKAMAYFASPQG